MSESPGSKPRRLNGRGADPDKVAAFAAANYSALRERRARHANAHRDLPLDPVADELRRRRR
jgi:hypothetical protein